MVVTKKSQTQRMVFHAVDPAMELQDGMQKVVLAPPGMPALPGVKVASSP